IDLVDPRPADLARQLLLVLPVVIEKLSPSIEVAGLDGLEDAVAEVFDAMETVGDTGVIDALLLLHRLILVGEHFARVALRSGVIDMRMSDEIGDVAAARRELTDSDAAVARDFQYR